MRHLSVLALATGALAGCAQSAPQGPGQRLEISVAPLKLDAVEEVSYGLRVRSANEIVWEQTGLTSTQYGDGKSAITYIGTCDASADANPHSVELWIENIKAGGVDLQEPRDFINPAHADAPVIKTDITCLENADVPVEFNLTVLRNAQQGFFDIAVNFEDIFCSAKVDCVDALLHHGDTRDATVVVGFACTSGAGEQSVLEVSDLALTCTDGTNTSTLTLPAAASPGQQGSPGQGVFEWAVYQGDEALTSNGEPLEKCFWNRAVGLDKAALAGQSCHLSGLASASTAGGAPPATSNAYPFVRFDVDVLAADGTLCGPNPLNGAASGVTTEYLTTSSELLAARPLAAARECSGATPTPTGVTAVCSDVGGAMADGFAATQQSPDAIVVTTNGGTLTLPMTGALAGFKLSSTCCLDGCCATRSPTTGWSKGFGPDTGGMMPNDLAVDHGNACATGELRDPIDFGGGLLQPGATTRREGFVACWDVGGGVPMFSLRLRGTTSSSSIWGQGIAFTEGGQGILVTGAFEGAVDIAGTALDGGGMFIAKLDIDGNLIWARAYSGAGALIGRDIVAGPELVVNGNTSSLGYPFYVLGLVTGTVDLGAGVVLESVGGHDAFLARFDESGNVMWGRTWGGSSEDDVGSLAHSPGDATIVAASSFNGMDAHLTKLAAADGATAWERSFGPADGAVGSGVAVAANGDIIFSGDIYGATSFDGGATTIGGGWNGFVARMSASAAPIWSRTLGSSVKAVSVNPGGLIGVAVGSPTLIGVLNADGSDSWLMTAEVVGGVDAIGVGWTSDVIVGAGGFSGNVDFGHGNLTKGVGEHMYLVAFPQTGPIP